MSEKIKNALFNSLGDIEDLTVLDAFAGSGALSFESVSRGAKLAVAVDNDRLAQKTIGDNISDLGLEGKVKLVHASAAAWMSTTDEKFDVVICDPPYNDPQLSLIQRLAIRVKPGGVLVVSLPMSATLELNDNYKQLSFKNHGEATLAFYRRR